MNRAKLFLIISREFSIRVKKKSFILMTILTPVFFAALIILPSLIMTLSGGEKGHKILVVDRSGICEPFFKSSEEYKYSFDVNADVEKIKRDFKSLDIYALVEISPLDSVQNATLSTFSVKQLNMDTKKEIETSVEKALEKFKLKKYNIDNFDSIMKDVQADVSAKTFTVDELGKEKAGMVEVFMVISYLASFMIYIFIFMFGSMVMRGVIEEKTNRVVEVLVSSVKPFELMLGKILGIGSVALLQFLIWVGLTIGITFGFQAVMGGQISPGDMPAGIQAGTTPVSLENTPMNDILAALAGVNFLSIGAAFIVFFLLGYLLYASMFSAVGSAVDNETDTQQLTLPVTLPLILGLFIMIHTFQYPDSSLSFWGSMIPFTSPMVMMARVPFGVPLWEMLLSIALLLITFLVMTYISAKIYRIGILSYGKKAGWKDLWKWIKY